MEPDTSTASSRSRPLAGNGSGSPSHCGRALASSSNSQISANGACCRKAGSRTRARRPLKPSSSARKLIFNAASPLSAGGSQARSSQGRGAIRKTQGQANSNMFANPDRHRLVEAGDGLVIQAAVRAVGALYQDHPAGQAGRGATAVEEGQPGAAAEDMAVTLRVTLAAQTFENGVELLQPGAGIDAVVRFAQAFEFVQRGLAQRIKRCFARLFGSFAWQAFKQLESGPQQYGQEQGEQPPARCRRPPADRRGCDQRFELVQWVHRAFLGRWAFRCSRSCSIISLWVFSASSGTPSFCARRCQRAWRASARLR